jgi:GNAT superfamily N-acetyltransferase
VAIDEKYQGKGVNAIMMNDILKGAKKLGITKAETNLELEYNNKVQNMWKLLPHRQHKRRRCYIKEL